MQMGLIFRVSWCLLQRIEGEILIYIIVFQIYYPSALDHQLIQF